MAKETISNSPNISVLEGQITSDLCLGKFFINVLPSLFLGSGANNVLGAKIQIVNPYGVTIKPFGAGYDIMPPMTSTFQFDIPKQSGAFQIGVYAITIALTDANGTVYDIIENTNICQPNPKNKKDLYGILGATIKGSCREGKVVVLVNEPPIYNGVAYETKVQSYILSYPTGSLNVPLATTQPNFEVAIFEGEYKLTGDVCVTYNFGNNNFAKVPYKVNKIQPIRCEFDACPATNRLLELAKSLNLNKCKQRDEIEAILNTGFLHLDAIYWGQICDADVTEHITQLEKLLGVSCRTTIGGTVPINGIPAASIVVQGVGVQTAVVGLTTIHTIDNYEFRTTINPANNSIVSVSPPTLSGSIKTQELTFSIAGIYAAIKTQVVNPTEYDYWANIIKNSYIPSDTVLACMGITMLQYTGMTYAQFEEAKLIKMCGCCGGATCLAEVSNATATLQGVNTLLTWDNNADVASIDIFVDGNFVDNLLNPLLPPNTSNYLLTGYNNNVQHTVTLTPKCSNGINGAGLTLNFTFAGCPTILAPSLSSNSVPSASCPFNLGTIIFGAIPSGLTLSWHNANNISPASLVPNPASVTSGTYFAFYTDVNGCNSPSSQVQITCAMVGNCTEPLSFIVEQGSGSSNVIMFTSALTPPPSYLVKRRLSSDPDISGSYTTIGVPVFNAGIGKWQITDNTSALNTLYTYIAESQCADGSRPSASYRFAHFSCPAVTLTPASNSIAYSFAPQGGQISKYDVQLYDSTETTLLATVTYNPAFANPITGSFTGLTASTAYKVRVLEYIGTSATQYCAFIATATNAPSGTINVLTGILGLTIGNPNASGTITGVPGSIVNIRITMSGTDAAAVTSYNIDGTAGSITNATSGLVITKTLTGGSINWTLGLATTVSSEGATITLV